MFASNPQWEAIDAAEAAAPPWPSASLAASAGGHRTTSANAVLELP
jgi:hypothetical protein